MSEHHWLISKRLKGLVLLLLLTGFAQILQAAEENAAPPLIIENIPDSPPEPAEVKSAPASGFPGFADTLSKVEASVMQSSMTPEAVKTFLSAHPGEIQWTKEHPLQLNAFALVLAILVRICWGDAPKTPKARAPQAAPQPVARKKAVKAQQAVPAAAASQPVAELEPEPEKNPFHRVLDETLNSPVTPARDTFIVQTFLRWAAAEPRPSYQWALGIEDAAMGRRLLTEGLLAEETKDSSAAFDLALSVLPAELQDDVIDAIVRQWSRKNPQAAAEKIASLPSGTPVLQTAIAALVETWTALDLEAAHHWLVALPINLFRDLALSVFIQRLMLESPESAAAWVESIANEQVRQQVAGMVAQKWHSSNPEAAQAWAEKAAV